MKIRILCIYLSEEEMEEEKEIISELTGLEEISEMWNHYCRF